jgi:hypothetical protein
VASVSPLPVVCLNLQADDSSPSRAALAGFSSPDTPTPSGRAATPVTAPSTSHRFASLTSPNLLKSFHRRSLRGQAVEPQSATAQQWQKVPGRTTPPLAWHG